MTVEKVDEKYRCNICGNEVIVTKIGGGTLVCCGEDMEKIEQILMAQLLNYVVYLVGWGSGILGNADETIG